MAWSGDNPERAGAAVLARRRRDLAELDFRREVRRLLDGGDSVEDVAVWVGLPLRPEHAQEVVRAASEVSMPVEGLSGATPYEICERYSVGEFDRAQLIDELKRYPYVPGGRPAPGDDLIVDPPGTSFEISHAKRMGLVDEAVYRDVFDDAWRAQADGG